MREHPGYLERGRYTSRLDAFVDAAFAFALTLLVIAGDRIPSSVQGLVEALKNIPAFALSFLLVVQFWSGHVAWRRAYGVDDVVSRRLSLLLVFLVLVFVYPMRMMFEALCNGLSNGFLPATYTISDLADVPRLYVVFAFAFGSMGATMTALYWHAWRQRYAVALTPAEVVVLRGELLRYALIPAVCLLSIALSFAVPLRAGILIGLPGFVYFLLNVATPLIRRRVARRIRALGLDDA